MWYSSFGVDGFGVDGFLPATKSAIALGSSNGVSSTKMSSLGTASEITSLSHPDLSTGV